MELRAALGNSLRLSKSHRDLADITDVPSELDKSPRNQSGPAYQLPLPPSVSSSRCGHYCLKHLHSPISVLQPQQIACVRSSGKQARE